MHPAWMTRGQGSVVAQKPTTPKKLSGCTTAFQKLWEDVGEFSEIRKKMTITENAR